MIKLTIVADSISLVVKNFVRSIADSVNSSVLNFTWRSIRHPMENLLSVFRNLSEIICYD